MSGIAAIVEKHEKNVQGRKDILQKHLAAGKDASSDVVKRDRKILKRSARKLAKLKKSIAPKKDDGK